MTVTKVALEELVISLKSDLSHADKHVAELATWKSTAPSGYEIYAAAMLLHHLYGAVEAILEQSLKTFDGKTPEGEGSHVQLLEQASTEVDGVRIVVLPRDGAIDELRRFRHLFRKRYDVSLESIEIHPVIKSAVAAWPRIRNNLATWEAWVLECAKVAQ